MQSEDVHYLSCHLADVGDLPFSWPTFIIGGIVLECFDGAKNMGEVYNFKYNALQIFNINLINV
jgi:hypothetical protein